MRSVPYSLKRPQVRAGLCAAGAAAVLGTLVLTGLGGGNPAHATRVLSGSAWLASSRVGQLTLLDGTSGEVVAQVQATSAGDAVDVVQQNTSAYAIDRTQGTLRRVDGATNELGEPASPIPDAHSGLTAFAGEGSLYVLDTERGLVVRADPHTLAAGQPESLAARVTAGASIVDDSGRLWVLGNDSGDLISVRDGRRTENRQLVAPGTGRLALAGGRPVVVDQAKSTAMVIDPGTGRESHTVKLDLRPDDAVHLSGSAHHDRLYLAMGRGAVAVCELSASNCDRVVPLGSTPADLGAPVEVGDRLFVPDRTNGKVWIVDLTRAQVLAGTQVLEPPGDLQLTARDGIVFFNDPNSERAGVIRLDGTMVRVAKYDPGNPAKGLPGYTPPSSPTSSSQPPAPPTSTSVPPPQPPGTTAPPPPPPSSSTQPPSSPPPPPSSTTDPPPPPPPTLHIALSKANPVVNEDITLQVRTDTGVAPASAVWTFGDGQQGNGVSTTHHWGAAQTFQIGVTATMPNGQQAVTSLSLQVSPRPKLPAPVLVSPANNVVLTNFPRNTTFTWQPVAGAAKYFLETECLCGSTWSPQATITTPGTSQVVVWPGDNQGRWRVTALEADGTTGIVSNWRMFSYQTGLRAPVQVSPANGATFHVFPRTTNLVWQAVPTATQYRVERAYWDPGQNLWVAYPPVTVATTSYTFDFVGAQPGRWRVTALAGATASPPSPWWTFTYTI